MARYTWSPGSSFHLKCGYHSAEIRPAKNHVCKTRACYAHVLILISRELEQGLFYSENHGQFLGSEFHIPLYEAQLVGGQSLIYQIDCGAPTSDPDFESQGE